MVEPLPPIDAVVRRHAYRQRDRWARRIILLAALVVLAAAPLSAAEGAPRPTSADTQAPTIAARLWSTDGTDQSQIVGVRADGQGGVRQLVPGMHNQSFCQSADGRKMAYYSDREAPHEYFVYVANADGADAKKITEKEVGFECPFSERWLLLAKQTGRATTIIRHDLQTGAEKTVVTNVDRFSLGPGGRKLLFVGGLDFTPVRGQLRPKGKETLELLDLTTLERRRLAAPLVRAKSYGIPCSCVGGWLPDRSRIAYTVGPSIYADARFVGQPPPTPRAHRFTVYVQPLTGGQRRRVLRLAGGQPLISWSPDGSRLLVCANNRGLSNESPGCSGVERSPNGRFLHPKFAGKLLLVELARRSVRRVVSGKRLAFAQWAPAGGRYAYATPAAAYVVRPGGARRLLASAPKPYWPGGGWMGWSRDGRYIGLGSFSSRIAVLNVATRQIRVLLREKKDEFLIVEPRWWR
jgi:hypothetical protein